MKESIISHYENYDEDQRAFGAQSEQLEFLYTKKLIEQYLSSYMSVIELGCGTGYYGLYLADKCESYCGVDVSPQNIERFKEVIAKRELWNATATVGDATSLAEISDNSFDIVLNLGPIYHLPQDERQKAILESKRICKDGGIILFAYINKIGAYLRACLGKEFKMHYPNKEVNKCILQDGMDDVMPDIFFYTMPEEIENEVTENGLSVLKNVGVDFAFTSDMVNSAKSEQYSAWKEILDYMVESSSCTGTSNHAVLVCQK